MKFIWLALALLSFPAHAGETIPGPLAAYDIRVIDGDTFKATVTIWPGHRVTTSIRVAEVDTPALHGKCQSEKDLAERAKAFVEAAIRKPVVIRNIRNGKFAGRQVAEVWIGGKRLSAMLIAAGLGRTNDGGKRKGWCG